MANLLNIAWESGGKLSLNVTSVFRVDAKDADEVYLYYNVASESGPKVHTATLKFSDDISSAEIVSLQAAVKKVQQIPNGIVEYVSPVNSSLKLDASTPYAITSESAPV